MKNRIEVIRNIRLGLKDVKINKSNKFQEGDMENPCWEGYEPYGTKILDGREVPNCVPVEAKKVKEGFPIPSPSGDEDKDTYVSRCISEISGEYEQDQAVAICIGKWEGK